VGQNIAIVAERNKEMSNRILKRWGQVLSARSGDAVLSPSGVCLRTWADIESEAREFEKRLSGSPGGVGLQTGNHPSFPALVLAGLRARRPLCLFDAEFFGEARSRIEQQLGVTTRVVVSGGELRFEHSHGTAGGESGACLYKLTSGTTSLPQAIGFTADQLVADCDQVCGTMGIGDGDLNYGVIAMTHSYGFSNLATPLLCRGVRLVVATDPLPRAIEQGLRSTGASVLAAVPAMFRGLLTAGQLPETLRLCISAGSLLDPVLAREFFQKFGRKIHAFYGASECGGICYDASEEIPELPGFVGLPLDGVEIEMPDDAEGARILVRSAATGIGRASADGGFQPTDLLVCVAGGFRIVGRESELINVAGRKVNPMEIERVLAQFPGVSEAVVCGVEDPARGQETCALIAAKIPPDVLLLRHHCAAKVPSWKMPRRFAFVLEIPRNARGKISRAEIARTFF
jgi:long-chain acyl-CoA synthetase